MHGEGPAVGATWCARPTRACGVHACHRVPSHIRCFRHMCQPPRLKISRKQIGTNPKNGMMSFDNFFAGVLEVFTILSMSGWNELMYSLEESETPWAVPVYFALVVAVRSSGRNHGFAALAVLMPSWALLALWCHRSLPSS